MNFRSIRLGSLHHEPPVIDREVGSTGRRQIGENSSDEAGEFETVAATRTCDKDVVSARKAADLELVIRGDGIKADFGHVDWRLGESGDDPLEKRSHFIAVRFGHLAVGLIGVDLGASMTRHLEALSFERRQSVDVVGGTEFLDDEHGKATGEVSLRIVGAEIEDLLAG